MSGADATDDSDAAEIAEGPRLPAHLYIHVPFCRSKCSYCDFCSVAGASEELVGAVFRGLESELHQWARSGMSGVLETVYVGGGTPTLVAEHVARLLERVRAAFVLHPAAEVTVEANPDSTDPDVVSRLADAGTTRVSIGVQSFDDGVLRLLGRAHEASQATAACEAALLAGLGLSVDLMCGVPGQSITSWGETLDQAVRTGATHVSVYPLSVEEGTPLSAAILAELVEEVDPDLSADMLLLAEEVLGRAGLARYEVSNYARPGHESLHNQAYWTGAAYLGVGPGAHGMLESRTASAIGLCDAGGCIGAEVPECRAPAGRVRVANGADIEEWLVGRGGSIECLTAAEAAREDVMLALRLVRGVRAEQAVSAGVSGVLGALEEQGLVELAETQDGTRWRTTRRGWLLGNEVFSSVWVCE